MAVTIRRRPSPERSRSDGPTLLAGTLCIALGIAGCGGLELESWWRDGEIRIDGDAGEWRGRLTYVEDLDLDVGVANDTEALYVCLVPHSSKLVNEVLLRGLTVWVDPSGGKQESFGVRFPLGAVQTAQPMGAPRGLPQAEADQGRSMERPRPTLTHLEIRRAEATERLERDRARPLEVALEFLPSRSFVYEARIPMVADDSELGVAGVRSGRTIGVGLETAEIEREARPAGPGGPGSGGGPPAGGPGGGFGGPPSGAPPGGMRPGGRGPGGRPGAPPEPLHAWARVRLAAGPAGAGADSVDVSTRALAP